MSTLNEQQRTELDDALELRERELHEGAQRLRESLASPAAEAGREVRDSVEDGDARMATSLDLTQLQRDEAELRGVLGARQRMRDGTYGICQECGDPIPYERLRVRPEATLCIADEEASEKASLVHGQTAG